MNKIAEFLKKPFAYAAVFGTLLTAANGYVLLRTFMIPSVEGYVTQSQTDSYYQEVASEAPQDAETTGTSYSDENIQISISTVRYYDTDVYIADVKLSSAAYLKFRGTHRQPALRIPK